MKYLTPIACLAGGLLLSLGLGWMLARDAAVSFDGLVEVEASAPTPAVWSRHAAADWPARPHFAGVSRQFGRTQTAAIHNVPGEPLSAVWESSAGWPVACLHGAVRITDPPLSRTTVAAVLDENDRVRLRGIVWWGLAIDAMFFASIAFLLTRLARAGRRLVSCRSRP